MLRLKQASIGSETIAVLARYQAAVDVINDYAARVTEASRAWTSKRSSATMRRVRQRLGELSGPLELCHWCDTPAANEIEHVRPKDLYPNHVFVWANLLLSCGKCNRNKSNRFGIVSGGAVVDVTRTTTAPVRPPKAGLPAIIEPRHDDPFAYFHLDLDVFVFIAEPSLSSLAVDRADYTIDLLDLNRDELQAARKTAYWVYRDFLIAYRRDRDAGETAESLSLHERGILQGPHPTVWREMQRQRIDRPELKSLFEDVPEALTWD